MNHPSTDDCVGLRTDLEVVRQERNGPPRFVIRDPVGGGTFLLSGFSYALLSGLDGRGLGDALCRAAGLTSPTPELMMAATEVVWRARHAGLLNDGKPERSAMHEPRWWRVAAARKWNPLFIPVRLVNPQGLVRLLRPISGVVCGRTAATVWLTVVAATALLVALHWPQYRSSFAVFRLFRWWPAVYGIVLATTLLHEMGHVLVCDRYAVAVNRAGLLLCFLVPAAFADVSGAWLLPKRRDRIAVSLAGVYVEAILWSAATLVWYIAAPWTPLSQIGFVLSICIVGRTALNLFPFLRLDGYWVLADLLDMPGLRRKSFEYLASWLPWIGHWWRTAPQPPARTRLVWFGYGVAALAAGAWALYMTGRTLGALLVRWWPRSGTAAFWLITVAMACAAALNVAFHLAHVRATKAVSGRNFSAPGA